MNDGSDSQSSYSFLIAFVENISSNLLKNKNNYRYSEAVLNFAQSLFILGGRNVYEFVRLNLPGALPALSTLNASLEKAGVGIEEAEFRYDLLHHHQNLCGYQVAVCSEDSTAVMQKIIYSAATNTFTGFSTPLERGIPICRHYQTDSFDQLKYWFENKEKSNCLNVHMVQPLIASNPYSSPFLLASYGISNTFTAIDVLNRWLWILKKSRQSNVRVVAFSTDCDPRYLLAMRLATGFFAKLANNRIKNFGILWESHGNRGNSMEIPAISSKSRQSHRNPGNPMEIPAIPWKSRQSRKSEIRRFPLVKQQQYKIIQEAKRTWLNINVDAHEKKYQEYEHQYQQDLKQFEFISSTHIDTNDTTLFNCFLLYIGHRIHRLKQEIYYEKLPVYRRKFVRLRRRLKPTKKNLVTIAPIIILDLIRHPFTVAELAYLSRGPTYIRPNQSALRPSGQREKQVDKKMNDIINKVKNYMANVYDGRSKIPTTVPMYKFYSERLRTYLLCRYMIPLPLMDQLRARRELKLDKSIRRKLKNYKLVLRETDKSGVLHIGHARDYERKAMEYREKTGAHEELTSNPLDEIFYQVIQLLNKLRSANKISVPQKLKMMPIRNKIELAYMYFLHKSHKKGTPLRPIINTIHAATTQISKHLDELIRPLFDRYARHTTIVDGVDLLSRLHKYIQNGYFNSSTLFVAFDITNLYTILPQEESLVILAEFLHVHHCDIIQGISIDTILDLGRIVPQANAFVYGKKFCRQIIGSAMGSVFTLTLANIFMWKWERQAILSKLPAHEFYGRYIDDIFFTCNESETKVKKWLESANQFHPNIKLTYTIAKSVPFLDVLVCNQNGILFSSVYHKPAAELSLLSFLSDHPRHVFRNVIQTALMRAIRYSSTFEALNIERRSIRLTLLLNE
ncbi:unnamed protein product [Rotaria sp. Silwood2]|nr:unnamed protein product [Rotaria sp. Silwood2]